MALAAIFGLALAALAVTAPAAETSASGAGSQGSFGLIATVPLNVVGGPWSLGLNPVDGDLYIGLSPAFSGTGLVVVVSSTTDAVLGSVATSQDPLDTATDPVNGNTYVPNYVGYNITVISGATAPTASNLSVGTDPQTVAFDPANGDLYVGTASAIVVLSGSSNSVVATIPTDEGVSDLVYAPSTTEIYALVGDNVTVVSSATNTVTSSIPLPGSRLGPGQSVLYPMLLDPATGDLYIGVSVDSSDLISTAVVSTLTDSVLATILNTGEPVAAGAGDVVYGFAPGAPANVSVISGSANSVTTTFGLSQDDFDLIYDSANGGLVAFPTNPDGNDLELLSGATGRVETTVDLPRDSAGDGGFGLYDPANGRVYLVSGLTDLTLFAFGPVSAPGAGPFATVTFVEGIALGGTLVAATAAGLMLWQRRRARRLAP